MSSSPPQFDERTADVIRAALTAAQAGQIEEALSIGRAGLISGCDQGPVHAMLGSFLLQSRKFETSLLHLEKAEEIHPQDPIIRRNLASALVGCGRYKDALESISAAAAGQDPSGNLSRLRGYAAQQCGEAAIAKASFEDVLKDYPEDWETWNNLGNAREVLGDFEGAIAAFRNACRFNPKSLETHVNLALTLYVAGKNEDVESLLRGMTVDFPHEEIPWRLLYMLLKEQSWDAEAKQILEGALERAPANVPMLTMLGREQLLVFDMEGASKAFRDVLKIEPTNGDAFIGLADILEREAPSKIGALVAEAEQANVDPDAARILRASFAYREKRYQEGLDELEPLAENTFAVRRWHLEGLLSDRMGDTDRAFAAFSKSNSVQSNDPTKPLLRAATLRADLKAELSRITPEWKKSWRTPPINAERASPIFLMGFPRSGTTLLDTLLMGHPDVEVLEEKPVLHQVGFDFGGFGAIGQADETAIRKAQARYFELAGDHAPLRKPKLIDKSPLHTQHLPLIYRLFPDAQVIFALRHPADVLLSCYMANFRLNSSMANFLALDTAAEFYDITFSLWEKAHALLPVETHRIVYEQLIADPEGELKALSKALGLAWEPSMLDHQRTAEQRGVITTASYAQVTQPIYREADGRWRRYRKHLEPVLPTIRPWIERFGYSL